MTIRRRISALFSLLIVLIVALLMAWGMALWYFNKEGNTGESLVFVVPQGSGLIAVANGLEEEGIIGDANFFRVMAMLQRREGEIKFGEYEIPARASMDEVLNILLEGKAIQLSVTFPEGWTSWQVVQRLNEAEGLIGRVDEIPAEGSLAPNTYTYLRGDLRSNIVARMQAAQAEILDTAWEKRDQDLPLTSKEELLTLASIVEKETGDVAERALVASVFVNRLMLGMKLQTDPTVIYGITLGEGTLGRGIRKSELKAHTPYNTYIIDGLPPTPICNPGADAIMAAANPVKSDFRFFVAKSTNPSEGHNFAKTLEEHNRNVAIYRAAEAAQN